MRTHRPYRGVSLLELLIAMAITAIVLAGAIVVVRSQQKAFSDGQRLRGAQGSARRALLALEQALPLAGFGMDAALAFDLNGWYAPGSPLCPTELAGCARDSVANPDELVFFAREPNYWIPASNADDPVGNAWRISAVTSGAVSVYARQGDVFRKGQIFLAVCPGSSSYAYFTSDETVPSLAAAGVRSISLKAVDTSNPFRRQDVAAATACFTTTPPADPARLFLVNRFRFHVRPVAVGTMAGATLYDPLLVLDRGVDTNLDNAVDTNDELLLAEGIESIQVTYLLNSGALAPVGATSGSVITRVAAAAASATSAANTITTTLFPGAAPVTGETVYTASSFYRYTFGPPAAAERATNHQANIQAVRVSVLARSTAVDVQANTRASSFLPLANQNALPTWITAYPAAIGGHDGYQRVVLDTTVSLPNMSTRAMTYF